MPVSKETKTAVKKELLKGEPLMDLLSIKRDLLSWLEQLPIPRDTDGGWVQLVQEFPAEPEDAKADTGICIRLTVRLNTATNRYMIALLESLDPESRGVYFATVHVNWNENEYRIQEAVEQSYAGHFDGFLKAKHNLWTQTFRVHDIHKALNSCAMAILGHELTEQPQREGQHGERIPHDIVAPPEFPGDVEE